MIQIMCDRCGKDVTHCYNQLEFTDISKETMRKVNRLPVIHLCDVCLDELLLNHGYGKLTGYSQEKLPL